MLYTHNEIRSFLLVRHASNSKRLTIFAGLFADMTGFSILTISVYTSCRIYELVLSFARCLLVKYLIEQGLFLVDELLI